MTKKHKPRQQRSNAQCHADRGRHYHAYILRCWGEPQVKAVIWRFSLEAISSGERIGFAELDELLAFLNQQTKPQKE